MPLTEQERKDLAVEYGKTAKEFIVEPLRLQMEDLKKGIVNEPTLVDKFEKMNNRLSDIELKLSRPGLLGNAYTDKKDGEKSDAYKAFDKLMRRGPIALGPEERKHIQVGNLDMRPQEVKVLTESDATGGGFLGVPEFVQEIIKGVVLYSPVRSIARIRQTSNRSVRVPKRTGTFAAAWTGEINTRTETTGLTYGMDEIPVHELYALADISNADLEDSAFDLNAELQLEFSEQFAKAEGAAFVNGTSVMQPEGFMTNPAVASSDKTGSATLLTYAGMVQIAHNLPSFYAQNATWGMNRKTIGLLRQMVDGQSRPIWLPFGQSGLNGPNPPTILDIPYQELPDMPDVATNAFPVVIGDFKRGYMIVDRINIEVQRDPFTQNTKGCVRFIARKRVGGQVILAEAFRTLKVST